MFLLHKWELHKWNKNSLDREGAKEIGKYKSFEEAKSNLPKGFIESSDPELIKTHPHYSITDEKNFTAMRHYIQQK